MPRSVSTGHTNGGSAQRKDAPSLRHRTPASVLVVQGMQNVVTTEASPEIDEAFALGRARWPQVNLSLADFRAHVLASGGGPVGTNSGDLYLAAACAHGHPAAVQAFEREVLGQVGGSLRSLDPSREFADEVIQRLRTKLLVGPSPRIAAYRGSGPLAAWVNVSAIRTGLHVLDSERRRQRKQEGHWSRALLVADSGDVELDACKREHLGAFREALAEASAALSDRERAILRSHFADGLSIDKIGTIYGVHRATAARWINRAKMQLGEQARARLAVRIQVAGPELDSVLRAMQSQLDIGFSQLIPEGP